MDNNVEYSLWRMLSNGEISIQEYNVILDSEKQKQAKLQSYQNSRQTFRDANKANTKGYSKTAMFRK